MKIFTTLSNANHIRLDSYFKNGLRDSRRLGDAELQMIKKKCPCDGCAVTVEALTEFDARIRLIAHVAARHVPSQNKNSGRLH